MSNNIIKIPINTSKIEDYEKFLMCKELPYYEVIGNEIHTTQSAYDWVFRSIRPTSLSVQSSKIFDYQGAVANTALYRKSYAAFLDCGLGKTAIILFWAKQVASIGKVLLLCPLQVMDEFMRDAKKFGIDTPITNLRETNGVWSEGIGIVNYEYERDIDMRHVAGIALDESSILKNGTGVIKSWLCSLSAGVEYRLAASATPAPNDQSEYASHAVFLGINKTNKEFYSRFFRKDGTDYVLKPHGVKPFYESMSSWACYIHNPKLLGFECGGFLDHEPEIIEDYLPGGEHLSGGLLFPTSAGLSDSFPIQKYRSQPDTPRFNYVVEKAMSGKSVVWCKGNDEESAFHKAIPNSALITGKTPIEQRVEMLNAWRGGEINCIISKPKILGWGVNMQQADLHVYSGYDHSFEAIYQAIRRSHRFPRQTPLRVYFPQIAAEVPLYELFRKKLESFRTDVEMLQGNFKNSLIK